MIKKADSELFQLIKSLDIISPEELDEIKSEADTKQIFFPDLLVEKDLIDSKAMGKILADFYELPFVDLSQIKIPNQVLNTLPQSVAEANKAIVFELLADELHLATALNDSEQLAEFLTKKTGLKVKKYFATSRDILQSLALYNSDIEESFKTMLSGYKQTLGADKDSQPPIIEMVNSLISHAYDNHASDIHIEPNEAKAFVRFRIDGLLYDKMTLPLDIYEQVNTRIKVMAHLRTDERQAAQDGKISHSIKNERLDIRVSFVPVDSGENIVLRLLSESNRQFSLSSLGFSAKDIDKVKEACIKPHGMILFTGPTGSGKTTSMYAILKLLNKSSVNIMTIEDPVEYDIERVQQIQVNPETNLTFALGLRSIVRQDPDIILVGEIRDDETASIAVNAAMTGHLLLSTLHTNNAATTLPRLIDMGIEPYLITSTINVIVAQRLVRKICQVCRVSRSTTENDLHFFNSHGVKKTDKVKLYHGKGCGVCNQSGYNGRIAIFEVLILDDEIKLAIVNKLDAGVIEKLAIKNGMSTMFEDGIAKVEQGITTIEEILRVTK